MYSKGNIVFVKISDKHHEKQKKHLALIINKIKDSYLCLPVEDAKPEKLFNSFSFEFKKISHHILLDKPFYIPGKNIINRVGFLDKEIYNAALKKYIKIQTKYLFYPKINGVPVSGKVYNNKELENLIEASLEGWWTEGKWNNDFEEELKKFLGVRFVYSCNSGSSANLLAFTALMSTNIQERRIKKGDEIITVAAGFPTTINPIIQCGCVPVFVDVNLKTYDIDVYQMQKALSYKTKAVIIAHTLGNPFNLKVVKRFCDDNNLWLIEDNCDALGSKYDGKLTGTFGDLATLSFYPAHHVTTAEGGAVLTNNSKLSRIIQSIRDWGRHCWCPTGKDNTCKNRFSWQLGNLPKGYDHKYVYGELGYNLKMSDLHAAIGVAQMGKLLKFTQQRKKNFKYLYKKLKKYEEYFILPQATENSDPSWFGFLLTIRDKKIDRAKFMSYLTENKIGTRLLFAGNITKQPYFTDALDLKYRIVGNLKNTDIIMEKTFWIGVYQGLDAKDFDYIDEVFSNYFNKK